MLLSHYATQCNNSFMVDSGSAPYTSNMEPTAGKKNAAVAFRIEDEIAALLEDLERRYDLHPPEFRRRVFCLGLRALLDGAKPVHPFIVLKDALQDYADVTAHTVSEGKGKYKRPQDSSKR
ncbi:MAG: hypothetical protein HY650_09710 [Acidobacteria bacterium]|nr:hypothetical protein [Acidobacteriota bacterium]